MMTQRQIKSKGVSKLAKRKTSPPPTRTNKIINNFDVSSQSYQNECNAIIKKTIKSPEDITIKVKVYSIDSIDSILYLDVIQKRLLQILISKAIFLFILIDN